MLRVGLTGGLASGKTFVGHTLAGMGCLLIEADEIGRQAQQPGGEAYDEIVRVFGREFLNPDGTLDRRKLAAHVFHDPAQLEKLNAIVHPVVIAKRRETEAEFERQNPHGIAVTEAAILIETGSYRDFDRMIVAICRPEQQMERAMSRGHLTREEVLERMRRQMPLDEKVKYADYIIDTSGPKEHTLAQTRAVYESLRSLTL
ncbi:MAG TPA: dephospho-CoA kinase [Bryobacteraceae bacterium]|jgi:dephospho-CoA kinase